MESIGEKIKRIRKSKGISQTAISDSCGIKQSSFANIESGKTQNITIEIGKGIAKVLGVSFNKLFEIDVPGAMGSEVESLLNEKNEIIANLQKQIEQKDLLIDVLQKEKEIYKQSVISSINSYTDSMIAEDKKKLESAKTEDEILYFKKGIEHNEKNREYLFKNFIYIGFLTQEDIENYYKQLKEEYEFLGSLNQYLQVTKSGG